MKHNKVKNRDIILLIAFLFVTTASFSQKKEAKRFSGYLKESPSKNAVQFGAVKNIKTGEVTLTDGEGFFNITGSVGDTLKFHSLGYKDTTWVVPGVWFAMDETIELKVKPNIYSLQEVEVIRYYSYAHFKQAFKDLRLEKTEEEKAKERFSSWSDEIKYAAAMGYTAAQQGGGVGVGVGINGKSKDEKKREEVERLEKIREKSTRFNYFLSRENIMHLTDYKGTCLDSFMVFLNTGYNLHYQMPEYDLLASILEASKDFKNQKGNEDWFIQSF